MSSPATTKNLTDNSVITKGKLANRYFITVCLIGFCLNFAQNVLNSSVPLYMTSVGISTAVSGMIAIPFAIAAIVARILAGYWSDHMGRRVVLVAGCLIYMASAFPFGLTSSIVLLFLFRTMHGFGFSMINTALGASTMDTAPPEKTSAASGFFYLPSAISTSFCGLLVVQFTGRNMFAVLFFLVAALQLVGAVLSYVNNYEKKVSFRKEKRDTSSSEYRGIWRYIDVQAIPAMVIAALICSATCFMQAYILLYGAQAGIPNYGLFFTVAAPIMLLMNLFSAQVQAALGRVMSLLLPMAVLLVGFCTLSLTGSVVSYYILAVGYALCFGVVMPTLYNIAVGSCRADRRGAASGTVLVGNDIGVGLGTALWGVLIAQIGYESSMLAAGAMTLICGVAAFLLFRKGGKRQS